jgi:hypothetical protein
MTVLQVLEQANTSAGIATELQFADIREFNSFVDSFNFEDFPVNILVPYSDNGQWGKNGVRRGTLKLQGWMLTRVTEDPNNYRSKAMEENYLADMRHLAKVFIQAVINSDIVDPEANTLRDNIRPEYMFLNMHTFGVYYEIDLPIKEFICLPTS